MPADSLVAASAMILTFSANLMRVIHHELTRWSSYNRLLSDAESFLTRP